MPPNNKKKFGDPWLKSKKCYLFAYRFFTKSAPAKIINQIPQFLEANRSSNVYLNDHYNNILEKRKKKKYIDAS